jgi:hypothetical protein
VADFGGLTVDEALDLASLRDGFATRGRSIAADDQMEIVLRYVAACALGRELPAFRNGAGRGGAPNDYPPLLLVVYFCWLRIFRSTLRLDCQLRCALTWHRIRRVWLELFGEELLSEPVQWDNARYYRKSYLDEVGMARLVWAATERAIVLAHAIGLLRPEASPNWVAPPLANIIGADGTWVRPFSEVHQTRLGDADGEMLVTFGSRAKRPEDARIQHEKHLGKKDGRPIAGLLHVTISARHPHRPGTRVILNVMVAPPGEGHGEATTMMQMLRRLLPMCQGGVHGLVVDGILAGVHFDELTRRFGILVISKQPAYGAPRVRPPGDHPEHHLGFRRITDGGETRLKTTLYWDYGTVRHGRHTHRLAFDDGVLYEVRPDRTYPQFLRKTRRLLPAYAERARTSEQGFWFRATYTVRCRSGAVDVHVDLPTQPVNGTRPSQYVRLVPEIGRSAKDARRDDGPLNRFVRRHGLREDLESGFRWYKFGLPFRRATSITRLWQWLDFQAAALLSNALTWWEAGCPDVGP